MLQKCFKVACSQDSDQFILQNDTERKILHDFKYLHLVITLNKMTNDAYFNHLKSLPSFCYY